MKVKINTKGTKYASIFLIIFSLSFSVITVNNAFAIFPVWPGSFDLNTGGVELSFFMPTTVTVSVTDPAATGSGTITVRITSSVDPEGFDLTLNEGSPGVFTNTNLALMSDDARATMSSTVTITVFDDTTPLPVVQTLGGAPIFIVSDSDPAGFALTLTETGPDTNLYTTTINFDTTTDSVNNIIAAAPGDIFTVGDVGTGNLANGFIEPNPNLGKGAIQAEVGGTVTATYQDVDSSSFVVSPYPSPGRGSGGLVNPGLVVDNPSSVGSGGCSGDCVSPTLGLDKNYNRIVNQGFSYNDNPVDVELFYTPYPLITTNVGQENVVVLKIFENGGMQNIEHVGLAFGLSEGQFFSQSKATINLDRTLDGREKVSVYDPENTLDNVKIVTSQSQCAPAGPLCLVVTIYHTFREPLEFNMVATDVWDFNKNSWQNYYNHGIDVRGDSLNPPKTKLVAFGEKEMRGLYELTQIDKKDHLWIDEFGNLYQDKGKDRFDRIYTVPEIIQYDKITMHGCNRECNWFDDYKLNQIHLAEIILSDILMGKKIEGELKESFSHSYNITNRAEDPELQKNKKFEIIKAEKILEKLLDK